MGDKKKEELIVGEEEGGEFRLDLPIPTPEELIFEGGKQETLRWIEGVWGERLQQVVQETKGDAKIGRLNEGMTGIAVATFLEEQGVKFLTPEGVYDTQKAYEARTVMRYMATALNLLATGQTFAEKLGTGESSTGDPNFNSQALLKAAYKIIQPRLTSVAPLVQKVAQETASTIVEPEPEKPPKEINFSPEALEKFRQEHSVSSDQIVQVAPSTEGGAGNVIAFHDDKVYRINKPEGEGRKRLDSPTIVAMLQEAGEKTAIARFPIIYSFGTAVGVGVVFSTRTIVPYETPGYRKAVSTMERLPAIVMENLNKNGWKTNRALSHEEGLYAEKPISPDIWRLDCLNAVRRLHYLISAQMILGKYGLYLSDYKGSFGQKLNEQGELEGLKILDIDDIRKKPDSQQREQLVIREMLAAGGIWEYFNKHQLERISQVAGKEIMVSPEFQSLLFLNLACRQFSSKTQTLSMLDVLAQKMIAGDFSQKISFEEYLEQRRIMEAEEKRKASLSFVKDGKTGCLKIHNGDSFLQQAYGLTEETGHQIMEQIGLANFKRTLSVIEAHEEVSLPEPMIAIFRQLAGSSPGSAEEEKTMAFYMAKHDYYGVGMDEFITDCLLSLAPVAYRQSLGDEANKNIERLKGFVAQAEGVWPELKTFFSFEEEKYPRWRDYVNRRRRDFGAKGRGGG